MTGDKLRARWADPVIRAQLQAAMRRPHFAARRPLSERFWEKVKKPVGFASAKGCWLWIGVRTVRKGRKRYGQISSLGKTYMAHIVSWELHTGSKVPEGLFVLHKCDNEPCVRFDHLFLGTAQDNTDDMVAKGRARSVRGSAVNTCILTENDVRYIRSVPKKFGYMAELARQYDVSFGAVRAIIYRKSWAWLE